MLFNKCDSFIIKNKQAWLGANTTKNYEYLKTLKFTQETCHLDYFIGLISVTSIICICLITIVYLWKYKYFWNFTQSPPRSANKTNDARENGLENGRVSK